MLDKDKLDVDIGWSDPLSVASSYLFVLIISFLYLHHEASDQRIGCYHLIQKDIAGSFCSLLMPIS